METKEMTLEELRKAYEEMKESRDYWMEKAAKSESRFKAFQELVKSIIILAD